MRKDFIEKQKKALIAQRQQILDTIEGHDEQMRKLAEQKESGDVVDIASDTIDRVVLDSIGQQDRQMIQMIGAALDRIEQGKYGICLRCGKPIAEGRLEALPYAAFCIPCQTEIEKEGR